MKVILSHEELLQAVREWCIKRGVNTTDKPVVILNENGNVISNRVNASINGIEPPVLEPFR